MSNQNPPLKKQPEDWATQSPPTTMASSSKNEQDVSKPSFNEEMFVSLTSHVEKIIDKSIKLCEEGEGNNTQESTLQLAEQLHAKIIDIQRNIRTLPMIEISIESIEEKQKAASQRLLLLNRVSRLPAFLMCFAC
jgi:hypothetical protein